MRRARAGVTGVVRDVPRARHRPPGARQRDRAVADRGRRDRRETEERPRASRASPTPAGSRPRVARSRCIRNGANATPIAMARISTMRTHARRLARRRASNTSRRNSATPRSTRSIVIARRAKFTSVSSTRRGPTFAAPSGRYRRTWPRRRSVRQARSARQPRTASFSRSAWRSPVVRFRSDETGRRLHTERRAGGRRAGRRRAPPRRRLFEWPRKRAAIQCDNARTVFRIDARRNALDTMGFS
ncbi:Uncharacterised protein [Burkholderia pseudomallei]|nr:hypothetical protein DP50_3947 [Burkholderia pseudomallei 576]AJX93148.1 hypothetical protein BG24_6024 [Burkholderia pseudomallei PB08298010]KGD30457.1 hypothetical protein DP59_4881 [Burkholderia pseudomallei]CAJ7247781.1 Uncharacterised protein [Burkholderia pseudomallei]